MRLVSLGDSFTEGVGDERPDGSVRGWADRVAQGIADASGEPLSYANFAIRGLLLEEIVRTQVPKALALDPAPTLVTFNGGGNDMLRPRMSSERLLELTAEAFAAFASAGIPVVALAGPDPTRRLPLGRIARTRGDELTQRLVPLAAEHGFTFVNTFHDTEVQQPHYWSKDRLHMGPAGHRRVASLVMNALGYPAEPFIEPAGEPPVTTLREQIDYGRRYVLPWVGRRLRGTSSSRGRSGKHATWVEVTPSTEPRP